MSEEMKEKEMEKEETPENNGALLLKFIISVAAIGYAIYILSK